MCSHIQVQPVIIIIIIIIIIVFPRNLTAARFNFKSLHPAVKFRGRRDFKGGDYSTHPPHACALVYFDSANLAHALAFHVLWIRRPFSMQRDFEGSRISRSGKILRKYGMDMYAHKVDCNNYNIIMTSSQVTYIVYYMYELQQIHQPTMLAVNENPTASHPPATPCIVMSK